MPGSARGQRRVSDRRGGRIRRLAGGRLHGTGGNGGRGTDGRIRLLRFLVLAFLVLVGGRAVALAASSDDLAKLAEQQQTRVVDLPAERGAIVDRNGQELAVGTPRQTVYAAPHMLDHPAAAARKLCDALLITRKKERRAVQAALSRPESGFAFVARTVDPGLAKAALALDLPGVGAYAEEKRSYPMRGSAAQVIGFTDLDNRGIAGIELQYDEQLSGTAGTRDVVRDTSGRLVRTVRQTDPVSGADVRLTIDAGIQAVTEDILARTVRGSQAKAAVALVMDPRTGEILANANVPVVKNHVFGRAPEMERNRAVTDMYEPGSIFKLVTISGALADGVVKPTSTFVLQSSIVVADREISEAQERGTVNYSVAQIMQWSSNVGAVTIAKKMGKHDLSEWVEDFGFGKPTGVDFPGEIPGSVMPVDEWSGSSIGNIPMGQGIAVTPLQMATAACAVANNGFMVRPRLVAQVGATVLDEEEKRRVIPARVARQVRDMLALAVAEGTGQKAQLPRHKVAGKTGTSQKADGSGYSKSDYVASFVGMVPADRPRLVVLVAVDEPRTSHSGGEIAAPAVREIMSFALQHLEIGP